MNGNTITDLVAQVDFALRELADLMSNPATIHFATDQPAFEALERASEHKAAIDATFAWIADMHDAGNLVGSSSTLDYLVKALGISRSEAASRLRRGKALFDPPPEPPSPAAADEAEKRRAADRARKERKAQEEARRKQASAEKRTIIDRALEHLHPDAEPGHNDLLNRALTYSNFHSVADLRDWIAEQVRLANATVDKVKRHNIAFDKRRITFSRSDENNGVHVHMYLPADAAAAFSEAVNPARHKVVDGTDLQFADNMTWTQRRVNLLMAMTRDFLNTTSPNLKGLGSIVVSMTLKELENMVPGDVFPTNTGHLVDPFSLVRLGEARNDAVVIHGENGEPLHVDTGKRTANVYQRIALFASELVCSAKGCDRPMSECEAHHIVAHSQGGPSAMDNLTHLCWGHHRHNNDTRDPQSPFGWADRDPETGRAGTRLNHASPVRVNNSPAAARSGGAKIRRRCQQEELFTV